MCQHPLESCSNYQNRERNAPPGCAEQTFQSHNRKSWPEYCREGFGSTVRCIDALCSIYTRLQEACRLTNSARLQESAGEPCRTWRARARLAGDAERDARSVERVEPCGTEPSGARRPRDGERVARRARRAQDRVAQHMSSNTPPQSQLVEPTQRLDRKSSNNAVGRPLVNISAN